MQHWQAGRWQQPLDHAHANPPPPAQPKLKAPAPATSGRQLRQQPAARGEQAAGSSGGSRQLRRQPAAQAAAGSCAVLTRARLTAGCPCAGPLCGTRSRGGTQSPPRSLPPQSAPATPQGAPCIPELTQASCDDGLTACRNVGTWPAGAGRMVTPSWARMCPRLAGQGERADCKGRWPVKSASKRRHLLR